MDPSSEAQSYLFIYFYTVDIFLWVKLCFYEIYKNLLNSFELQNKKIPFRPRREGEYEGPVVGRSYLTTMVCAGVRAIICGA